MYTWRTKTLKKITSTFLIIFYLFVFSQKLSAENCNCTILEVQNNTVAPCNKTIGEVVTVNTVSDFRNAINAANSSNGNMTILIENGNYQIASTSWFPYITASNLVIRSASGNRDSVILRGGGMRPTQSTENIFLISGDNVTIADMTLQECGNHGIQVSGANLFVHNLYIKDTYEMLIKGATNETSIDSATVQCSMFEYTAGIGPNWYIGGLDIHKGKGWIVRDNVFKNIISPSRSVAEHAVHFWSNSSNNLVERNLIINCDRGIGFGLGSRGNNGGIIRNNMIYTEGTGQFADVGIGLETSPNTKVYNNTVYIEGYHNAIEYRFEATTGVEIKNNLTNKPIRSRNGGQATLATNNTTAQSSWFTNLDSGDLFLAEEIPSVVDMGTNLLSEITDDILKTPRPQGNNFDIGAYEWKSVTTVDLNNGVSSIKLYPNPNFGKFTIIANSYLTNGGKPSIEIFNSFGENIYVSELNQQGTNEIDISNFFKGICIVKISNGTRNYIQKVVVQ